MLLESVLAEVKLKSGRSRSMGPSWRVWAKTSQAKLAAAMARRSALPSQVVRRYSWLLPFIMLRKLCNNPM